MRIDRVYTRAGDDGRTSLGDGARLPKFHVRAAALGALDEANAVIGVALLYIEDARVKDILSHVQNDLFDLGADLSRPEREYRKAAPLRASERQVAWLEETIDSLNASLAPLEMIIFGPLLVIVGIGASPAWPHPDQSDRVWARLTPVASAGRGQIEHLGRPRSPSSELARERLRQ
jgi:Cobalamin adenosyltransferase